MKYNKTSFVNTHIEADFEIQYAYDEQEDEVTIFSVTLGAEHDCTETALKYYDDEIYDAVREIINLEIDYYDHGEETASVGC